jgi:hypothetical protein
VLRSAVLTVTCLAAVASAAEAQARQDATAAVRASVEILEPIVVAATGGSVRAGAPGGAELAGATVSVAARAPHVVVARVEAGSGAQGRAGRPESEDPVGQVRSAVPVRDGTGRSVEGVRHVDAWVPGGRRVVTYVVAVAL